MPDIYGSGYRRENDFKDTGHANLNVNIEPINRNSVLHEPTNQVLSAKDLLDGIFSNLPSTAKNANPYFKSTQYNAPITTPLHLTKRYNDPTYGFDSFNANLEHQYGDRQGAMVKWKNNLGKFLANTTGAFVESLATIPHFVDAVSQGDLSKMYNNPMSNAIGEWIEGLEDTIPNYETTYGAEHPIMNWIPFVGNSGDSWGGLLKSLGYTVGSVAGSLVQDAAVGALTGGVGVPAMIAPQIARVSSKLGKIFVAGKASTTGIKTAINRGGQVVKAVDEAARAIKFTDRFRYGLAIGTASLSESIFEANQTYRDVRDDLTAQFRERAGRDVTQDERNEIEKHAAGAGNADLLLNTALLTLTNSLTLGTIFKPARAAERAIQAEIIGGRKIAMNNQGLFEEVVSPKGKFSLLKKAVSAPGRMVRTSGVEGVEEGAQYMFQRSTSDYYKRKYEDDSIDDVDNFTQSFTGGLRDVFTTREGLENIFMGMLTGTVINAGRNAIERRRGYNQRSDALVNTAVSLLNSQRLNGVLHNTYGEAVTAQSIRKAMDRAIANNDVFEFQNLKFQQLFNFVNSGVKAGRFDTRLEQLEMLKDLDGREFEQMFGFEMNEGNRTSAAQYIDNVIQKSKDIKATIDKVNTTFRNPHAKGSVDHVAFEEYKSQLSIDLTEMKDNRRRLGELGKEIADIAPYINSQDVVNLATEDGVNDTIEAFEKRIKEINDGLALDNSSETAKENRNEKKFLEDKIKVLKSNLNSWDADIYIKEAEELFNYYQNSKRVTGDNNISPIDTISLLNRGSDSFKLIDNVNKALYHYQHLTSKAGYDEYIKEAIGLIKEQDTKLDNATPLDAKTLPTQAAQQAKDVEELDSNGTPVVQPEQAAKKAEEVKKEIKDLEERKKAVVAQATVPTVAPEAQAKAQEEVTQIEQEIAAKAEVVTNLEKTINTDKKAELPSDLRGAKPRYSYGDKQFQLEFESDIDKAAYIIAQTNKSKRDADYLEFVMDSTGMSEDEARAYGQRIRDNIKNLAKAESEGGTLTIPTLLNVNPPKPAGDRSSDLSISTPVGEVVLPFEEPITEQAIEEIEVKHKGTKTNNVLQFVMNPLKLFNQIFSRNYADGASYRSNLRSAIFGMSKQDIQDNTTISISESTQGQSNGKYKQFTKDKPNLYVTGYKYDVTVNINDQPVGFVQPADRLAIKRGEDFIPLYDATVQEYVDATGNNADTYQGFIDDLKAFKSIYDNIIKSFVENKNTQVSNEELLKYADILVSYGGRTAVSGAASATTLRDITFKPEGRTVLSFPAVYNAKTKVSERTFQPNVLNEKDLSEDQRKAIWAYIAANIEKLRAIDSRYVYLTPMPDGTYSSVSAIAARPVKADAVVMEDILETIRGMGEKITVEKMKQVNAKLRNNLYIADSNNKKGSKTNMYLSVNEEGAVFINFFNKELLDANNKSLAKRLRVPKAKDATSFENFIDILNQKIYEARRADSMLDKANIVLDKQDFKTTLAQDENVSMEDLEKGLSIAALPNIFEEFSISLMPVNAAAQKVVKPKPAPAAPAPKPTLAAPVPTPVIAPELEEIKAKLDAAIVEADAAWVDPNPQTPTDAAIEAGNVTLPLETQEESIDDYTVDENGEVVLKPEVVAAANEAAVVEEEPAIEETVVREEPVEATVETIVEAAAAVDTVQVKGKTAAEIFDLTKIPVLSKRGGTRIVYDLGKYVLKVATNAQGLLQNESEGQLPINPKLYERGRDYVIVEKVDNNELNPKLDSFINGFSQFTITDFKRKSDKLREYLTRYGVESILDGELSYGDIRAIENWGIRDGKITLLDAGSLNAAIINDRYIKNRKALDAEFEEIGDIEYSIGEGTFNSEKKTKVEYATFEEEAAAAEEEIKEVEAKELPIGEFQVGDKVNYQGAEVDVIEVQEMSKKVFGGGSVTTKYYMISDGTKDGTKFVTGADITAADAVEETVDEGLDDIINIPTISEDGVLSDLKIPTYKDIDDELVEDDAEDESLIDYVGIKFVLQKLHKQFNIPYKIVSAPKENWKGRWNKGVVEINISKVDKTTPFHEYLHPFIEVMKVDNQELYQSLVKEAAANPIFLNIVKEVRTDPAYAGKTAQEMGDESLVRYISMLAARNINKEGRRYANKYLDMASSWFDKFNVWFKNLLHKVLGFDSVTVAALTPYTRKGVKYENLKDGEQLSIQDIADMISLTDIKINLEGKLDEVNKMTFLQSANQQSTQDTEDKILAAIQRRMKILRDTADRRTGSEDLSAEYRALKHIMDNYDSVTSIDLYVRRGLEAMADANDEVRRINRELEIGTPDAKAIKRINRSLEVIKNMYAMYNDVEGLFKYIVDDLDPKTYKRMMEIVRKARANQKSLKAKYVDMTVEWLFPYVEQVNKNIQVKYPEHVVSKEKFRNLLFSADKDVDLLQFALGSVGSSTDVVSAITRTALFDVVEDNHLFEARTSEEIKISYANFLKQKGLKNEVKDTEEYYKKAYLRKAKVLEKVGDIVAADGTKTPKYDYVERWAFHEEYFNDLFFKERTDFIESLGDRPQVGTKEHDVWFQKLLDWETMNTVRINGEVMPAPRFRNFEFDTLYRRDEFFTKLYDSYKEANNKVGSDERLQHGVIPQISRKYGNIQQLNDAQGTKEKAKLVKDKLGNFLLPTSEETTFADSQENLDGSAYRHINVPYIRPVEERDLDFTLPETILQFSSSLNLVSLMRDVEPNIRALRTVIEGSPKLGMEGRKINQVTSKRATIFDHVLGLPAKKAKQQERLNTQLLAWIDDVVYGQTEMKQSLNILGRSIDLNRLGGNMAFLTALNNMAFNVTAGVSNVVIGNIQSIGESLGGKYYSKGDWATAGKTYFANTQAFLNDAVSLKKSKITQIGIKYDAIQGEFRDKYGKKFVGNLMQKYASTDTLFFLSHAAEHQIQLTGMLALMNATKVQTQDGQTISLYDAHIINAKGFLRMRDDVLWSPAQEREFTTRLHGLNKLLNGNYSNFDKAHIQRHWLGKLALIYRKFMYNGFRNRYGKKRVDYELGTVTEGYYRTFMKKLVADIRAYKFEAARRFFTREGWSQDERYAYNKTLFELGIFAAMLMLAVTYEASTGEDDDEPKGWFTNALMLQAYRLRSDIGLYNPIYGVGEMVRITKNPSAVMGTLTRYTDFFGQLARNPTDTYDRKTGAFEQGESVLKAKLMKAMPLMRQWINFKSPEEQVKFYQSPQNN